MTGKPPKELLDLKIPDSIQEVWGWFLQLNSTRSSGFGISAITYTEMLSFFTLLGIVPEEQELELIKVFDGIALEQARTSQEKRENKKKK